MNIPWNSLWHYTEVSAEVIGLILIGAVVLAIICGTIVWLKNCYIGWINEEVRSLRKFNKAMSEKIFELTKDKRFSEKEQKELFRLWVRTHFEYDVEE